MTTSSPRILVNAEPFGFGPSSAAAAFYPYLRERCSWLGYIGKTHTLDLQRSLGYDVIYNTSRLTPAQETRLIGRIASDYDLFFTALDFDMAARAQAMGLPIAIYDPILWFWKEVPAVVRRADAYIVQDFIDVRQRLAREPSSFPAQTTVVPAIVPAETPRHERRHVLVNLGGLQNPLWTTEDAVAYARTALAALRPSLPKDERVVIATSAAVAERLKDPDVWSYTRDDMYRLLGESRYAFMTPGLGNIYDAARYDIPTAWLPPANDSQGQQAVLLAGRGLCDVRLDWSDLLPGIAIDYRGDQGDVLRRITETVRAAAADRATQDRFARLCRDACARLAGTSRSAGSVLLEMYGCGGAERVADLVWETAAAHVPRSPL